MKIFGRIIAYASISLVSFVQAQEKKPTVFVRYMAVGESAPLRYSFQNGVRSIVPPVKWSEPPSSLWLPALAEDSKDLQIRLEGVGGYQEIDPNVLGHANVYQDQEAQTPWFKMKVPTAPMSTLVMSRGDKKRDWSRPRLKLIDDSLKSFPLGSVRLVNLTPYQAALIVDGKSPIKAKPGEVVVEKADPKDVVRIVYQSKSGREVTLSRNATGLRKKQRLHMYLYMDDGFHARGQARLKKFKEFYKPPERKSRKQKRAAKSSS